VGIVVNEIFEANGDILFDHAYKLGCESILSKRRDDAGHALRGSSEHAGAFDAMVVAQGLGDADCQAPRHEKSDCRAGPGPMRRLRREA
jgi:hypothetical protein